MLEEWPAVNAVHEEIQAGKCEETVKGQHQPGWVEEGFDLANE